MPIFGIIAAPCVLIQIISTLPARGAVLVQLVKLFVRQQFTSVDTGLDCSETSEDPDLLHVADDRGDLESFQFGVDRVKTADEVLEEKVEGLRKTQHCFSVYHESGNFLPPKVDNLAVVGGGIVWREHGRGAAAVGPLLHQALHVKIFLGKSLVVLRWVGAGK